jgi:hypothetical protein
MANKKRLHLHVIGGELINEGISVPDEMALAGWDSRKTSPGPV